MILNLDILSLYEHTIYPTKVYEDDAGLDLYSAETVVIPPGRTKLVGLGVAIAIEPGWCALLVDRSSMGAKGISRFGGLIDCKYRGEWKVILHNATESEYEIGVGDKIVQSIFLPVPTLKLNNATVLNKTERGLLGFGSSGK
jgi:dUTP pyrophosphatase